MKNAEIKRALQCAVQAAREVGAVLKKNLDKPKKVNSSSQHDIKLDLDVRSQLFIERFLKKYFPEIPLLGEEGTTGNTEAEFRWVVDPIDGTVNFTYGIPHACVSIALQQKVSATESGPKDFRAIFPDGYETLLGVVYDPFCDEMWTAIRGEPSKMNGTKIRVSDRTKLEESIISMGFAKYDTTLAQMMPVFTNLVPRVRKIRIMGAAAISLVWVAGGRLDAYKETGIRIWDVAAGGLIVACAGGDFWHESVDGPHTYQVNANNGHLRQILEAASVGGNS